VYGTVCQFEQVVAAAERAIFHGHRAGRRRIEAKLSASLAQALRNGPTPVPEAIERCRVILGAGLIDQQSAALTMLHLAYLHALAGEISEARDLCRQARSRLADLGGGLIVSRASLVSGRVELLAQNSGAAAAEFRRDYDALGAMGERYFRPLIGAFLARAVYAMGNVGEALILTGEVEKMAAADDVEAQAIWRGVRARIILPMGKKDEALWLTSLAVNILAETDAPIMQAEALVDRAWILERTGDRDGAVKTLLSARQLYILKSATLPLHHVDRLLDRVTRSRALRRS
jgi:ATP/maltotriose-dependent transcriptional regulator MalT